MSLPRSSTQLFCQRCASAWEISDATDMQMFTSSLGTVSATEYSSPAIISSLIPEEEISYCPKCHERELDRALAEGNATDYLEPHDKRVDPDGLDSEKPGSGDADVVFNPSVPPTRG